MEKLKGYAGMTDDTKGPAAELVERMAKIICCPWGCLRGKNCRAYTINDVARAALAALKPGDELGGIIIHSEETLNLMVDYRMKQAAEQMRERCCNCDYVEDET